MEQNFDPVTGLPVQPATPAPAENPFMAPATPVAPAAPATPAVPAAPATPAVPAAPATQNPFVAPTASAAPTAPAAQNPFVAPTASAAPTAPAAPAAPVVPAAPAAPTTPAWAGVEAPKSKKKPKIWLIVVIAVVVLALAAGAVYFFLFRGSPEKLFVDSMKKTFSDAGLLADDLKAFKPDSSKSAIDVNMDVESYGDKVSIDGTFACDGKTFQGSADVEAEGQKVSVGAELTDSELKLNLKPYLSRTIVYNYSKADEDSYFNEILQEGDMTQEDFNDALSQIYSSMIGDGDNADIDWKSLEKDITKRLKDLKFKKVKAQTIEVDGKDRSCKGYEFTLTSEDAADLMEIVFDFFTKSAGENMEKIMQQSGMDFDDMLDELKDTDGDATIRFYVYNGKLACLEVEDEEDDNVAGILFHGGDFRLQNVEIYDDDETVALIKGERKNNKETIRFYEVYDGDEEEVFAITYDQGKDELTFESDGDSITIGLAIEKDSLEVALNDFELDGVEIDGEIRLSSDPEIKEFKETKPFDLSDASEDEFMEFATEIFSMMY